MNPLFAGALPLTLESRLLTFALGAALGAILARRLAGAFSFMRIVTVSAVGVALLLGLFCAAFPDDRDVLAFVVGLASGVNFAEKRALSNAEGTSPASFNWLAFASLGIGTSLGLAVFAVLWWKESDREPLELIFYLAVFLGFGLFAGTIAASAIIWFRRQGNNVP